MKLKNEIAVIEYTENTGRKYIVAITNNPNKWLTENNLLRDEPEKLSDFEITWTTLKNY